MLELVGVPLAALVLGGGVCAGRWGASRAFGIRGFRRGTTTEEERGRPGLALARAGAAILGVYLACVLLFVPAFAGGTTVVDDVSMRVKVAPGGPAARAGIVDGDRVVAVNGETPADWDHLKKLVAAHPDETLTVEVDRAGVRHSFAVTTVGPKMMVGPFVEHRSLAAGEVAGGAFTAPAGVAGAFFRAVARTIGGTERPELSGPVAIQQEVARAEREGTAPAFRVVAAMASYQAIFVDLALLAVAFVTGLVSRRKTVLPTAGNSS